MWTTSRARRPRVRGKGRRRRQTFPARSRASPPLSIRARFDHGSDQVSVTAMPSSIHIGISARRARCRCGMSKHAAENSGGVGGRWCSPQVRNVQLSRGAGRSEEKIVRLFAELRPFASRRSVPELSPENGESGLGSGTCAVRRLDAAVERTEPYRTHDPFSVLMLETRAQCPSAAGRIRPAGLRCLAVEQLRALLSLARPRMMASRDPQRSGRRVPGAGCPTTFRSQRPDAVSARHRSPASHRRDRARRRELNGAHRPGSDPRPSGRGTVTPDPADGAARVELLECRTPSRPVLRGPPQRWAGIDPVLGAVAGT